MSESATGHQKLKRCPVCKREYPVNEIVCARDGTVLMTAVPDQLIGTTLADKYFVISEIGRGGMSVVYKGKHNLMDRLVAIKMLQAQLVDDPNSTKRFQQEAQAVSSLAHPNVISVFDYGIAPTGQPYLVMDFLVGESLADVIKRDNHITEERAARLFMQACDALQHAHNKGIIHRDLKASNLMLVNIEGRSDVLKVVDFGIAKLLPSSGKQAQNLTQTGEVFGSPIYMSPEQCLGQPLDGRSDVYAMGILLYESLTGYPPLMGRTIVDTMQMHVGTAPAPFSEMRPDLKLSPNLEAIVFKALQKSPSDRFDSMQSFRAALDHYVAGGRSSLIETPSLSGFDAEPRATISGTRRSLQGIPTRSRVTANERYQNIARKSGSMPAHIPIEPVQKTEPKIDLKLLVIGVLSLLLLLSLVVIFFVMRPQ